MNTRLWIRRLWYLANRRRLERELEREMTAHRAMMTEPRRFGNTTRLRDEAADVWGWRPIDDLTRDLAYAWRQLRRSPGFAATAILTLAIGVGATTAIFSVVNSLLLRPLPVRSPQRLAVLGDAARPTMSWSEPVWEHIRARRDLFDGALASSAERLNLARGGEAQFVDGLWVSGDYFDVLGVQPVLGRAFTADDDRPGGGADGPVAMISYDFWQQRHGGTPDIIGRPLLLDSVAFTIVGVAPPGFFGTTVGQRFDVAVPIGTEPLLRGTNSSIGLPTRNWLRIMVRLKDGQTPTAATASLRAIQTQIREDLLPAIPPGLQAVILTEPFTLSPAERGESELRTQYGRALIVLLVVVGLVLLIACVNIANLLLARAVGRRHEMSVRVAVGASRGRLARMLLAEAALLAAIGAAAGFALSLRLGPLLVSQLSTRSTVVAFDLSPDWRVFLFAAFVAVVTAALFGSAPAWHSTRGAAADALDDEGRGSIPRASSFVSAGLVGVQIAVSLVLIVGAGLFIRTFAGLVSKDLGFATNDVLIVNVDSPMTRYTLPQLVGVYERVAEAVSAVPGVARAALSDITPIGGSSRNAFVDIPGSESLPMNDRLIMVNVVSPGWFATYSTRLLAGRDFTATDRPNGPAVAVVNDAFARRFMPGTNPVGRTVAVNGARLEIVGLVEDAAYRTVRDPAPPTLYTSMTQREAARPWVNVSVTATAGAPTLLHRSIVSAIRTVDPDLTLELRPFAEQIGAATNQERLVALLSGFFGGVALLLASIGLYGVTAYAASRRRAEIGVRLALGAARSGVVRLVMRDMAWSILGGIVAGWMLSGWLVQFVGTLVWGLEPRDPSTFAGAAAILAAVGALAGWLPAWRASRIDPLAALRR